LVAVGLTAFDLPSAVAQTPSGGALGRYISPDFWGAVVIHPPRVAKSPLWADLPKMPGGGMPPMMAPPGADPAMMAAVAKAMQGFDVNKLRRAVVLLEGSPTPDTLAKTSPAFIIQFDDDTAPKLFAALSTGTEQAEYQGVKYVKLKSPSGEVVAFCSPDPQIMLGAPEPALKKMLTPPAAGQPLLDELRRVSLENDVMVAVVVEPLVKALGPALPAQAKPMVEGLKTVTATVNFSGDTLLHVDMLTLKEDTAAAMQMQFTMAVAMGTQQVQALKANPPPMLPPPLAGVLVPVLEEALAGTKVNKDALRVTADMKMPSKLPGLVKAVSTMAAAMSSMSAPAAKPADKPAEKPKAK
jgi:hypothetical protein